MILEQPQLPESGRYWTPAKFRALLDIGETTEMEWRSLGLITFFKEGRLVRYDPRVVAEFILRRTVQARMSRGAAVQVKLEAGQFSLLEERMQRFIGEQVREQFDRWRLVTGKGNVRDAVESVPTREGRAA